MAGRYFQLPDSQYSRESQYVPLPFDRIVAAAEGQQKRYDEQGSLLSQAQRDLPVSGGYRTKDRAKQFNEKLQGELGNLSEQLLQKGDIQGGKFAIQNLVNNLKRDPEYQTIKADEAQKENVDKQVNDPTFNYHVQDFYNPDQGFVQTKPGEQFDPNKWYKSVAPGNLYAEHKPLFDAVKPQISRYYNNPDYQTTTDEYGNLHTRSLQTGEEVESLTREQIKEKLAPYILGDKNALTRQSLIYNKALHEKMNPGSVYDPNDALNDVSNAFLGEFENRKEIQKQGRDVVTRLPKDGGTSSKKKGSGTGSDERDNVFVTKLDELNTPKPTRQADGTTKLTTGTTTVNDKEMAAFVGGNVVGNHIDANLTGRKIFLTTPQQNEEAITTRNAIAFNDEYDKMKTNIIKENAKTNPTIAKNKVGDLDKERLTKITDYNNFNTPHYSHTPEVYRQNPKLLDKDRREYKNRIIDEFKTKNPKYADAELYVGTDDNDQNTGIYEVKRLNKIDINKDPRLVAIKAKSLAAGIDLDNPETIKAIKNRPLVDPILEKFNEALENGELDGEYSLIPHKGKDNIITDKQGNIFGKNDIFMTEDQLDQLMPDPWGPGAGWKDLRDKKILKSGNIKDKDGNIIQGYMLPVTIQSEESSASLTRNMQLNTYGKDDKTEIAMPGLIQQSNDAMALYKGQKQLQNLESSINKNSQNQEYIINAIDEASKQDETGVIGQAFTQINAIEDKKEKNKEYADLYLMINDHSAWQAIHPELSIPQQPGTSQGNQNANPNSDLATKNNNPGNLRVPGSKTEFQKFNTLEEGFNAMQRDLTSKIIGTSSTGLGPNDTISDLIEVYAPASDNNDTQSYISQVVDSLGISPNTKLSTLRNRVRELAKAMVKIESKEAFQKLFQ